MTTSLSTALAAFLVLFSLPAESASLRCKKGFVSDRALQGEVLSKCGEPLSTHTQRSTVRTRTAPGPEVFAEIVVDTWLYDFGPHRLTQEVIFENGRLVDVRSGSYGTGPEVPD